MKLIYNTITETLLPWPRIDEEPVVSLDAHLLEMTVTQESQPAYDPATHLLEMTEVIDTEARTVTRGWSAVEVPAPTYTAEAWLEKEGYGGNRPTTLLYQKLRLDAAGKSSPKLAAVQAWLDGMIAFGLAPASSNCPAAPHSFEATLTETITLLAA